MKVIEIQNPCSENWATMTPNEHGAFCNSCQKTVIDFTHKTNGEIFSFFEEHAGTKICGRFEKSQFNLLNATYENWEGQSPRVFQSKFVLALVMVFGLSLFSCKGPQQVFNQGYTENTVQIESTDTPIQEIDSTKIEYPSGAISTQDMPGIGQSLMGVVSVIQDLPKLEIKPLVIVPESGWVIGDIAFLPRPIGNDEKPTSLIVDYQPPLNELENIFDPPGFEVQTITHQIADQSASLTISILTESTIEIILRDEKGDDLITVHNANLAAGEHYFTIDLSPYANGFYYLCIRQNGHEKIVMIARSQENS